jgi:hypothetical protein
LVTVPYLSFSVQRFRSAMICYDLLRHRPKVWEVIHLFTSRANLISFSPPPLFRKKRSRLPLTTSFNYCRFKLKRSPADYFFVPLEPFDFHLLAPVKTVKTRVWPRDLLYFLYHASSLLPILYSRLSMDCW